MILKAKDIIEAKCIPCLVTIWDLNTMINEFDLPLIHPQARLWIEKYPECKCAEWDGIYKVKNYDQLYHEIMKILEFERSNS